MLLLDLGNKNILSNSVMLQNYLKKIFDVKIEFLTIFVTAMFLICWLKFVVLYSSQPNTVLWVISVGINFYGFPLKEYMKYLHFISTRV